MNYENAYEYKASELKHDSRFGYKDICNEYGSNLGSGRRREAKVFDEALKLKRFKDHK